MEHVVHLRWPAPQLLQQDRKVGEGAPLWGSQRLRWGAGYIHATSALVTP